MGLIFGVDDLKKIGYLRLVQCLRVVHFTEYIDNVVVCLAEYSNIIISTGILRIFQMFILVVFLCHW